MALIPGNPSGLEPRYPTIAEHLGSQGYTNYLVGKWHLGQSKKKYHPLKRGFDHFYGLLGGGFNHYSKQQGQGRFDFWRNWEPLYDNLTHSTDMLNEEAVRVLSQKKREDSPFFLYLSYAAVHDPLQAPIRHQKLCHHVANYRRRLSCAMVAGIDEGIGSILQVLTKQGILEDTIIAFSIDNGGVPYAGALNYPLRGAKTTLFEGGVRSPGFIYYPKQIKSQDFSPLFHVSDFFPTLSALVNKVSNGSTPLPSGPMDGVNQVESLLGKQPGARTSVHIHRDYDRDGHAYRRGPWKVIVGHHCMPFFYTDIYNETKSRWLVEEGGLRSKLLQLLQEAVDTLIGTENATFLHYYLWVLFDSYNVGGIHRVRTVAGAVHGKGQGILNPAYSSDLELYLSLQSSDPTYPTVSLFNLEEDPSESRNLASQHPGLVKELLAEAEQLVADAPAQVRGDMVDADAPKSPSAGLWATLLTYGSSHPQVIPFGPYLEDDFDYTSLKYVRLMEQNSLDSLIIVFKVFFVFVLLPLVMLLTALKAIFL